MGRKKKKKQSNKRNNKKNNKSQSQQDSILEKLEVGENIVNDQFNEASYNNNNNNNNKKWKNKNKNKNQKQKQKQKHKHNNGYKSYKSELNQFLDQLRPVGLGIRNARSDGNCLFRAISDQISGNENNQSRFRQEIVEYMNKNNIEFAPFYVGDYDAYLKKMSKNGIWGGNMELTAAAKAFKVDIVIHSLNAARYEILYQKGKPLRTIHLSYHNERHYASVRRLDDMNSNKPAKIINLDKTNHEKLQREQQRAEIAWCHSGGNPLQIENAKNDLLNLTNSEQLVIARTNCYNIIKIKQALKYLDGDINAAVESILVDMSLMANEHKEKTIIQLKKQKEDEEKEEKNDKKNKKNNKKRKKHKYKNNKNNKVDKKKSDLKSAVNNDENLDLKLTKIKDEIKDKSLNKIVTNKNDQKDQDIVNNKNDKNDQDKNKEIVNSKNDKNGQEIELNMNSKVECIYNGCNFEHELLLVYLKHYKLIHLRNGKIENSENKADTMCPFGHKNQFDFSFCSECGWDLRYKPKIPKSVQKKIQKENIKRKPISKPISKPICNYKPMPQSQKTYSSIYNKYKKHMHKYWICKKCTFVNPNTNINCMVCSMINNKKCQYKKCKNNKNNRNNKNNKNNQNNQNNNNNKCDNWVSMAIKNTKQIKPISSPISSPISKPIKQKKRNAFGWICEQCTYENKPADQTCICGNHKPKKGKKGNKKQTNKTWNCKGCSNKNNTKSICDNCGNAKDSTVTNVYFADPHYDFNENDLKNELDSYNNNYDNNDNTNKWSTKGNDKCKCNSGKKYKKCCKKLEKHDKSYQNKFKHPEYHNNKHNNGHTNGHNNGHNNGADQIGALNKIIKDGEREIFEFKGKKNIKMQLTKKLGKLKDRRAALIRKLDNNKNKTNNAQNRNKNRNNNRKNNRNNNVYINSGNKNEGNGNNNVSNNAVANTTIAI